MFIEIRNIPQGKTVEQRILTLPGDLASAGGIKPEVTSTLEIRRLQETLFVTIEYRCETERVCDRCLGTFVQSLSGTVSFILQHNESEEEYADGESDCFIYEHEDEQIDFSQTLYDDIMLRVGYKAICDPNCKGLENPLKDEDEAPEEKEDEKPVDPRWAALGKLKKK